MPTLESVKWTEQDPGDRLLQYINDDSDDDLSDGDVDILDNAYEDTLWQSGTSGGRNGHQRASHAYVDRPHRRPLIDFVKNEWRRSESDHSTHPTWTRILSAPRVLRVVTVVLIVFSLVGINWQVWVRTQDDAVQAGAFGLNRQPQIAGLIPLQPLDPELVPSTANNRRLIFIGDVHGCVDELRDLLKQVQHARSSDHVIFTGDLIEKGPASTEVVDLARSINASCVRGNHEDRVLLQQRDLAFDRTSVRRRDQTKLMLAKDARSIAVQKKLVAKFLRMSGSSEYDELQDHPGKRMDSKQLEYIRRCPVILDVGQLRPGGRVHVVHAGLVPGVDPKVQDPVSAMTMRTMDPQTYLPSSQRRGVPWFKVSVLAFTSTLLIAGMEQAPIQGAWLHNGDIWS